MFKNLWRKTINTEQDANKVCQDCGKVHKHEEILASAASELTDAFFPKLWEEEKHELKEMSKKELAERAYFLATLQTMEALEMNMKEITEEMETIENYL